MSGSLQGQLEPGGLEPLKTSLNLELQMSYKEFANKHSGLNLLIAVSVGLLLFLICLPFMHWGLAGVPGLIAASIITEQSW